MNAGKKFALYAGVSIGAITATAGLWMASASALISEFSGVPFAPLLWWDATGWWSVNWFCQVCLVGSAALPSVAVVMLAVVWVQFMRGGKKLRRPFFGGLKPIEEGVTENHGRARWPDIAEMLRRYPPPPANRGGVVIGEARRIDQEPCKDVAFNSMDRSTWGRGGKAKLIIDDPMSGLSASPHSLFFIGTGGNKTMHAVATQYTWRGSIVTFDPSREIGPMVKLWREKLGQRVVFLGKKEGQVGINVLGCIKPNTPDAASRIMSMTASICGEEIDRKNPNSVFSDASRNVIACLIAHMMYDTRHPDQPKTIETLVEALNVPEKQMQSLLKEISKTSESTFARRMARTVMETCEETFSGAYFNQSTTTGWLFDPENARLLSGDIAPDEILSGGLSIYIQIPASTLMSVPGLGRVITDSIVSSIIQADGASYAEFMLFQADEAALLENMKSLEVVLKMGRKYGLAVQLIYTSINDMRKIWTKDGLETWLDGVSWAGFAAVSGETAEWLSKQLGRRGVIAYSEGSNRGTSGQALGSGSRSRGENSSAHEIGANLINSDDFKDSRTDEAFIITRSGRAFRCGLAPYYRRPEMAKEIGKTGYLRKKAA